MYITVLCFYSATDPERTEQHWIMRMNLKVLRNGKFLNCTRFNLQLGSFWKYYFEISSGAVEVYSTGGGYNERLSSSAFLITFCFVLCFQLSLLLAVCFYQLVLEFHIKCIYLLSAMIWTEKTELMLALLLTSLQL